MQSTTKLPEALESLAQRVRSSQPPDVAKRFENGLANTWNTTLKTLEDGTTFVITGDIPAMWLRDSAAQVRPFLTASDNKEVGDLIEGVVRRQFDYVLLDPYANAFNEQGSGRGHQGDLTDTGPWIWERKYEIDSLCYPIQLSYLLWKNSGRTTQFDENFRRGVRLIIETWTTEQHHEQKSPYRFQRTTGAPTDTLIRGGLGSETAHTGMTWSGFRPSDDACTYGYLVPSNMFAVVALRGAAEIARDILSDAELERRALELADELEAGIEAHGTVLHDELGKIYAYEVDGLGSANLMDDANVPSLLAIPYLGYRPAEDPVYAATREFILSPRNPYFYSGAAAEGIGSPHTPESYIWPIALAMQGMTAQSEEERARMLRLLMNTDAGTGYMHEGFHVDRPEEFTRPWFSWANMMFCELVLMDSGIVVKK
ncbi:glycoside hydrolase family 125 protein [Saccharibacillus sp. CPCC 101409]|uniref:glycoside hydrolase family 125 protein n=1 Tax=Saccharibacillus sp. CPCC 101409 TaxID=3058041 RepID=UPI002672546B|nr:glycoside hydrolase family 125 protein [Saccharibacillus sp. CPCC 101409]MDO3411768.1 glycoside hydrolase family 125 protein [Saccharibacillus sp. CPCC 101409]